MVPYCGQQLLGLKKIKNLLHLSLSKAGPFTLENHICVKALKCKVFPIIRCLIKPLLKNEWMCNTAREIEAATQPLCHSATQPLWQSGWTSHSATQPLWVTEWLSGWSSHSYQSVWVAEWLSGWVAAAEWLLQPLWQRLSGWVAAPSHSYQSVWVAEWLSGCGRVAAPATLAEAEWLSGCTKPLWQNVSVSQWSVSSITRT